LWGKFNNNFFPFGQPMLRVTMASIWTASFSVVLFFQILKRGIGEALVVQYQGQAEAPRWMSEVPALAGAWMFACSYQHWFQAGGAKGGIYTLNTFLVLAMVALLLRLAHRGMASRNLILVSFLFGLGLAHHWPNIVVMVPVFIWFIFSIQTKLTTHELKRDAFSPTALALFSAVFLLSSLVFLTGDGKVGQENPFFNIIMLLGKSFLIGLAPVALLLLVKIFDGVSVLRFIFAGFLGVTPYIALTIRSTQHPVVSWLTIGSNSG